MGPMFTLVRLALSLVGVPLIAFLTEKALGQSGVEEIITLYDTEQTK
jgi:hypothetical protein